MWRVWVKLAARLEMELSGRCHAVFRFKPEAECVSGGAAASVSSGAIGVQALTEIKAHP